MTSTAPPRSTPSGSSWTRPCSAVSPATGAGPRPGSGAGLPTASSTCCCPPRPARHHHQSLPGGYVTSIQPELWVDRGARAIAFYQAAFGAAVLHRVGDGEDI